MTIITNQNGVALPRPNFKYITNEADARSAMGIIDRMPTIAVDTETTGLDPYEAKWTLLQIGNPEQSFVFDVRYDTEHSSLHPSVLDPILKDSSKKKLLQNAVYDMKIIKVNRGYYLENIYDTMLAEQLLTLGLGFTNNGLAALAFKYLGVTLPKEPRDSFADYNQKFQDFQLVYAANDVTILHTIMDQQIVKLRKENLLHAADLEFRFTLPMSEMELNGILLDTEKWSIMMGVVAEECYETRNFIKGIFSSYQDQNTLFGVSLINIDSNAQLKKTLGKMGLELESTASAALSKYAGLPVIDALLDYRKSNKLISTYSESLLSKISKHTGRLHTNFKQMVSTGRMSSSNPNLQNIPKKQIFRSCFVAKPGYSLVTADMSGAELRILGNYSQDPVFVNAYASGEDLHTRTAAGVFDIDYNDVKSEMRNAAKAINFGLCTFEDTEIITDRGIVRIKDVLIGDTAAHDTGADKVIDKAYMGEKEVFEIETKYGYTLEATEDHLLKVINKDGEYVDAKLKDIDILSDLVCIKKGANLFPKNEVLLESTSVVKSTNYRSIDLPKELTVDVSAFLGLFVSEGSVFKVKERNKYSTVSFGFSRMDTDFIHEVESLLYRLFGDRVSKPKGEYSRYIISSTLLAEWVVTITGVRHINKTDEIRVPECIRKSRREHQMTFLKYLFEGDGTIKANGKGVKIAYSSKSLNLMKDVQLMLLNFGIISSITSERRKGYKDNYYSLSIISSECNDIFMESIGFVSNRKSDAGVATTSYHTSQYFIGSQECRLRKVIANDNISDQLRSRFYKKRLTDSVGNIYVKELSKYDDFFSFIYTNGVVPLPIKAIKSKGVKRVYDLSIENHPYFLANGFIVHNCYGMSPVGLAARLKISERDAADMIDKYFNKYKAIKNYLDKAAKDAVRNRYSETISGRRRYYSMPPYDHPDRKKIQRGIERQGMNAGIQGCLVAGTVVGSIGKIEDLVGKRFEVETGFGKDMALGIYSGKKEVYNLRLSNGTVIGITADHKLPVMHKGLLVDIPASELCEDDMVFVTNSDTENRFCKKVGFDYRGIEDTYDIMCDNIHYFVANGVIVHNSNADTIKESMVILVERLKNYDAKLILTVHDEVIIEVVDDQKYEVAEIVSNSLVEGFGRYFSLIPMETEALIGPSWLKGLCENKVDGKKCGNNEMTFVPGGKHGTKLVCAKCGGSQE